MHVLYAYTDSIEVYFLSSLRSPLMLYRYSNPFRFDISLQGQCLDDSYIIMYVTVSCYYIMLTHSVERYLSLYWLKLREDPSGPVENIIWRINHIKNIHMNVASKFLA